MPINTGNWPKALWEGVNEWYGLSYNEYEEQCNEIFTKKTSRKAFEEVISQSGLGLAAVKPEGSAVSYDTTSQGFISRFTHITYGLGFIVTKEMFDDDLYDVIAETRAKSLGRSMRITKETVAANVLDRAATAGYTGGDGVTLYSTAHLHKAGGTYSNTLATAAALSEAALETVCIQLGKFEDDRQLRIAAKPSKLIVPSDLQFEAERILNTDLRVDSANNDLNAIKSLGKIPNGFRVNNYLADTNAWHVITDVPNGMIQFERRADDFTMDNDHNTDNAMYKATSRYSLGWGDPRGIIGSIGA